MALVNFETAARLYPSRRTVLEAVANTLLAFLPWLVPAAALTFRWIVIFALAKARGNVREVSTDELRALPTSLALMSAALMAGYVAMTATTTKDPHYILTLMWAFLAMFLWIQITAVIEFFGRSTKLFRLPWAFSWVTNLSLTAIAFFFVSGSCNV